METDADRNHDHHNASRNLTHRNVTKEKDTFYVNGKPLLFYHFSGFDSGNQLVMLDKYSKGNNVLYELRSWYISQLEQNGQIKYATYKSVYNFFSNGEMISNGQRLTLRKRGDLQNSFRDSNPFMVERGGVLLLGKKTCKRDSAYRRLCTAAK